MVVRPFRHRLEVRVPCIVLVKVEITRVPILFDLFEPLPVLKSVGLAEALAGERLVFVAELFLVGVSRPFVGQRRWRCTGTGGPCRPRSAAWCGSRRCASLHSFM